MEERLRHLRTRRRAAIAFFISVIIFAVLYWVSWEANTDLFIVSSQANLRPLAAARDLLWSGGGSTAETWEAPGTEGLRSVLSELRDLPAREHAFKQRDDELERQIDAAWSHASSGASERIDRYRHQQMDPLAARRAMIQADVASLERVAAEVSDPITASDFRIRAINRGVDLATYDVVVAKKRAEVESNVADHYGAFISAEDRAVIDNLRVAIDQNIRSQAKLAERRIELRKQLDTLVAAETEKLHHQLKFIDFVYFSFGVATTVTFGDITPNHWFIRLLVTVQLISSIIVVGVFINSLAE